MALFHSPDQSKPACLFHFVIR